MHKRRLHFDELESTSTYIKENYERLENYTFVSCDYQTNGHGRMNRQWVSSKGEDLLFSLLIKDPLLIKKFSDISLMSAVVIYKLLRHLGICNAKIKWPNDVYVNNKKIAGILLESISSGGGIDAMIIGIGINVNSVIFDIDSPRAEPTSIALEYGRLVSLPAIKNYVYRVIQNELSRIKNGTSDYLEIVNRNNYLKNKEVYARIDGKKELVRVIEVNKNNSLRVLCNGNEHNIISDEVTFTNK